MKVPKCLEMMSGSGDKSSWQDMNRDESIGAEYIYLSSSSVLPYVPFKNVRK